MNTRSSSVVLLIVALCALVGFAQPVTVTDQAGVTLSLEVPVQRLISVYGIGTYYVYALGAGDQLAVAYYVGLRSAADAPATMLRWEPRLPEILSFGDPNVEALLATEPDLILADAGRHRSFAETMNGLGVPVVLCSAETPDAMMEAIHLTASLLGEAAQAKARAFEADHTRVTAAVSDHLDAIS
ncbi:MAG TPA: ABC transporter substrate-binding protein, partial [Candidatus Acetothermia bacterium]|nr:ABC transporter substrate-binding protein [Candidatus Acetothermia bacterium]